MTANFFFTPVFHCCFWIRDPGSGMGKNQDRGSGINIPDPQHWMQHKLQVICGPLIDLSICDSCSACSKSFRLFAVLLIDLSLDGSFAAAAQASGYLPSCWFICLFATAFLLGHKL